MEDATKEIWARPMNKLPVTKDLPRLAKLVGVYSYDHIGRLYEPSDSVVESLRNLLYTLISRLESLEVVENMRREFPISFSDTTRPLDLSMQTFFERVLGDESTSRCLKLIKFCNQSIIAPAVKKLKVEVLTIANFTKDLGWEIEIEFLDGGDIVASHIRKETCLQGNFTYSWKLALRFSSEEIALEEVDLKVVDLKFKAGIPETKKSEVTSLLRPLFDPVVLLKSHATQSGVFDLSHLNLRSLPHDTFATFDTLQICYLEANNLASLPASFSRLSNLKSLSLASNWFKDFPLSILQISSLVELHLQDNLLEVIPEDISNLTNLRELVLNNNRFKELPATVFSLPKLVFLNLQNNYSLKKLPVIPRDSLHVILEGTSIALPALSILEPSQEVNPEGVLEGNPEGSGDGVSSMERLANPRMQTTTTTGISTGLMSPQFRKRRPLLGTQFGNRLSMSITSSTLRSPNAVELACIGADNSPPGKYVTLRTGLSSSYEFPKTIRDEETATTGILLTPLNGGTPGSGSLPKGTFILDNISYPQTGKKYSQFLVAVPTPPENSLLIRCVQEIFLAGSALVAAATPSGDAVWVGDRTGNLYLWSVTSKSKASMTNVIAAHSSRVRALVAVGDVIWSSGDDGFVRKWSSKDYGAALGEEINTEEPILCFLWDRPDRVVGGTSTGKVFVWTSQGDLLFSSNLGLPILSICGDRVDGSRLWIGSVDSVLVCNRGETLDIQARYSTISGSIESVLGIGEGGEVWCGSKTETIVLALVKKGKGGLEVDRDEENGMRLHEVTKVVVNDADPEKPNETVGCFGSIEAGSLIWTLGSDNYIRILHPKTRETLVTMAGPHASRISRFLKVGDEYVWGLGKDDRQISIWRVSPSSYLS